jgi:hypothetical protein
MIFKSDSMKPLSLSSPIVFTNFFHNTMLHCREFIDKSADLTGLSKEELDNFDNDKANLAFLPKILLFESDHQGNFKQTWLDISECLTDNFPYSSAANYVYEQAIEHRKPCLLSGLKFKQEDGTEIYGKSLLFSLEEAISDYQEYWSFLKSNLLKESGCSNIEDATHFFMAKQAAEKKYFVKKTRQTEESNFEDEVFSFLENQGFTPLRQVKSGNLRMDLLIPGQLVIELKAGKVTADDVCQAIDYSASHSMDVLLVGTGLTSAATRGIEAVNKISDINQLMFVTRNACFRYLNGVLAK